MEQAFEEILFTLENYSEQLIDRTTGYNIYDPIFREYDKHFLALLTQLANLLTKINDPLLYTRIRRIIVFKKVYIRDLQIRKFYSLCYLGCVYILTGKLNRRGVLDLFLGLTDLATLVSKYDRYFEGLIINDFDLPSAQNEHLKFERLLADGRVVLLDDGVLLVSNIRSEKLGDNPNIYIMDNTVLIIANNEIKQWNPDTNEVKLLHTDTQPILQLKIRPDKSIVFNTQKYIKILDTEEPLEFTEKIKDFGFKDDKIGIATIRGLYIWGGAFRSFPEDSHFTFADKIIVSHSFRIEIYDWALNKLFTIEEDNLSGEMISDDLLMVNYDEKVDIINVNTGKLYTRLNKDADNMIWLPGDKFAISDFWNKVEIIGGGIRDTIVKKENSISFKNGKLTIANDKSVIVMI